jgi:hypothetical protein
MNTKRFGPSGLSTAFKNTNKYEYRCYEICEISHPAYQSSVRMNKVLQKNKPLKIQYFGMSRRADW